MWDCRLEAGRLFAQHTNDKTGSFEVVRFDLKKIVCLVPSVDSGVICCRESGRWSCALFIFARFDLCVICVLDLMFCRCHDSCQGRVFSHFLCLGANPNTNGTDRFGFHLFWSGLRRGVALSGSVSCFRIFSAPDVLVAGPGILASDHYLFRERRLQESSESEGMFFARYMQVHENTCACGRFCLVQCVMSENTAVAHRQLHEG